MSQGQYHHAGLCCRGMRACSMTASSLAALILLVSSMFGWHILLWLCYMPDSQKAVALAFVARVLCYMPHTVHSWTYDASYCGGDLLLLDLKHITLSNTSMGNMHNDVRSSHCQDLASWHKQQLAGWHKDVDYYWFFAVVNQ